MPEKECAHCGAPIPPTNAHGKPRRYCASCNGRVFGGKRHRAGRSCAVCGQAFTGEARQKYCGDRCRQRAKRGIRLRSCLTCGEQFASRSLRLYCTSACAPPAAPAHEEPFACCDCGTMVTRVTWNQKRCATCREDETRRYGRATYHKAKAAQGDGRTPMRYRVAVDKRSRRIRDVYIEPVTVQHLGTRDAWRCHLCRRPVDPALTHPHPMSASIDHVLPISLGGMHSFANTALAHLRCNLRKHVKVIGNGEQLRMVG